jgi:hypothetical protein
MKSTYLPVRKLFLLLGSVALLAASFVLTAPRPASALPSQTCDCEYYSDATYTNQVGEKIIFCNGGVSRWGSTTSYVQCYCDPCY